MSRHDIKKAFSQKSSADCRDVELRYIDGGRQSEFTFRIAGRDPVIVIWDGATDNDAIAAAAVAKL